MTRTYSLPDMAWHAREELRPDFVEPGIRRFLSGQTPQTTPSMRLTNRIAFIGDSELCSDLSCFADVQALHPSMSETFAGEPPDMLLIGGDWPRAGDPWREALLNVSEPAVSRLREVITQYKARGIPCTLWITGEAENADALLHLCDAVDVVFVPSNSTIVGARTLDAGVNVKTYNPFKEDAAAFHADLPYFRFVVDGAHELSQNLAPDAGLELLRPFLAFNSWLIDSSYHFQNANMKLHAACRRRFLGHVDVNAHAFLMKTACGVLLPSVLLNHRPAHFHKRALQAAACKTLVLTDADGPAESGLLRFNDAAQLQTLLSQMLDDEIARAGSAHLAWREALSQHTFFERLEEIFAAVGVQAVYSEPKNPSINVVIPTIRPEQIHYALEMVRLQTYDNIRLTVVANGVRLPEDIARTIRDTENAKLCFVPADKTIGYCMNFGIDQADTDYWAKWDDDDVYGPHYLEDQMLQRKYVDFDVAGKSAIFNYIEERDCVYIRNIHTRDALSKHIGGGTLLAKNDGRYFAENGRGGEDKAFLLLARERGDCIIAGDPFNFLQVRRADIATHTWTQGAHAQNLHVPARPGLWFENIIQ